MAGAIVFLLAIALFPSPTVGPGGSALYRSPGGPLTVRSGGGVATTPVAQHWLRPVDRNGMQLPVRVARSVAALPYGGGGPPCDPLSANLTLGVTGLNASINTTPASGVGPTPFTFGWNISVYGGGLPPYYAVVSLTNAAFGFYSTAFTGNVTTNVTGILWVYVFVEDSTCTEVAGAWFPVQAYGALGPDPVNITANLTTSTVPANVTYTVNTSNLPSDWSVQITAPNFFAPNSTAIRTYYLPGRYNATGCFVEPAGQTYACSTSADVTVGGSSPLDWGANVTPIGNATGAANVTFWANETNLSLFPNGSELILSSFNGTNGAEVTSNGPNVSLTEEIGCGYPWPFAVPPSGVCGWTAQLVVWSSPFQPDEGILASVTIVADVNASGPPSSWYPSVSYTYSAVNGSAPLNLTVNLTASAGHAPYGFDYAAIGRSSPMPNATLYAPVSGLVGGWNGSTVSINFTFNRSGIYWVDFEVFDSDFETVAFALPLVTVNYTYVAAPLAVRAAESNATALSTSGSLVAFVVFATGGSAPYSVQWSFGDGSFGSSVLGSSVDHAYDRAGRYDPAVRVTDGAGRSAVVELPAVVVPPAPTGSTSGPGGSPASGPDHGGGALALELVETVGPALLAAVVATFAYRKVHAELQAQGEEIVRELEAQVRIEPETTGSAPPGR